MPGFVSSMSLPQVPGSTDLENDNDADSESYEAGSTQLNLASPWPSQVLGLQSSESSSQSYISCRGHSEMQDPNIMTSPQTTKRFKTYGREISKNFKILEDSLDHFIEVSFYCLYDHRP
jgi:hypothetical protein